MEKKKTLEGIEWYVPGLQVYIASSQPDCYFPPSGPIERPGYSRDEGVMYN